MAVHVFAIQVHDWELKSVRYCAKLNEIARLNALISVWVDMNFISVALDRFSTGWMRFPPYWLIYPIHSYSSIVFTSWWPLDKIKWAWAYFTRRHCATINIFENIKITKKNKTATTTTSSTEEKAEKKAERWKEKIRKCKEQWRDRKDVKIFLQ